MSAKNQLPLPELPSWPATFCACNIILAISATILVTHALVLNAANEKCLENLVKGECSAGIIPSCTLEKALLVAQGFLFFYSIFLGFNSIFWMIRSCCNSHYRRQGLKSEEVDKSALHIVIHGIGCLLSACSIVSLTVLSLHGHFLVPTIQSQMVDILQNGKSQYLDQLQNCLSIFDNVAWNIFSIFTLIVCLFGHMVLIAYLCMKRTLFGKKIGDSGKNSGPNVIVNDFSLYQEENDSGRIRIPSSRNYPSSPIILKPFGLSSEEGKKFDH